MLIINENIVISENELEIKAVRSQGAGGQNVNKVATAIHLRFDITKSSLPDDIKERLRQKKDRRITAEGIVVIKAQRSRTQEKNREDALKRLKDLIQKVMVKPKKRKPTKPGKEARQKRLDEKSKRSKLKEMRSKIKY